MTILLRPTRLILVRTIKFLFLRLCFTKYRKIRKLKWKSSIVSFSCLLNLGWTVYCKSYCTKIIYKRKMFERRINCSFLQQKSRKYDDLENILWSTSKMVIQMTLTRASNKLFCLGKYSNQWGKNSTTSLREWFFAPCLINNNNW
jgi:hypothetical protein